MFKRFRLTTPWAIVLGAAIIAAGIYFCPTEKGLLIVSAIGVVATGILALIAVEQARLARRVAWFTAGSMERHSDQQRQIAAHQAGIKMIWWDPNQSTDIGKFPFDGVHDEPVDLQKIYIGIPLEYRKPRPSRLRRFWFRS